MKQFQFLLLDTGPIIKLFELDIWDTFIEKCDVTICRSVVDEAKYASQDFQDIRIDIDFYEKQGLNIENVPLPQIKAFHDKLPKSFEPDPGEEETLAFMFNSSEDWTVCAADHIVFKILGFFGKADQGISLEEVLEKIGLSQNRIEWQYTKKFREKCTNIGKMESIQNNRF